MDQVKKIGAQRMGTLGPLLNKKTDLSIRKGVLLHKRFERPKTDYACSACRFVVHSHVRMLQVLQSHCLRLAIGAPW